MNPNWPRWIKASVVKHFDRNKGHIPMYVDGFKRESVQPNQFAEFRMDGPLFRALPGQWLATININVIVTNNSTLDGYLLDRNLGIFAAACATNVNVFKLGDGQEDDSEELLGCLVLEGKVFVHSFGLIMEDNQIFQGMVDAVYHMTLDEEQG